mmetsp:Transcript_43176/g.82341  ORF Transcript_43176/g.82341 Transcript_43176/m.82341 type:complete len:256 (-) Transcript_43176:2383-3150(-)
MCGFLRKLLGRDLPRYKLTHLLWQVSLEHRTKHIKHLQDLCWASVRSVRFHDRVHNGIDDLQGGSNSRRLLMNCLRVVVIIMLDMSPLHDVHQQLRVCEVQHPPCRQKRDLCRQLQHRQVSSPQMLCKLSLLFLGCLCLIRPSARNHHRCSKNKVVNLGQPVEHVHCCIRILIVSIVHGGNRVRRMQAASQVGHGQRFLNLGIRFRLCELSCLHNVHHKCGHRRDRSRHWGCLEGNGQRGACSSVAAAVQIRRQH